MSLIFKCFTVFLTLVFVYRSAILELSNCIVSQNTNASIYASCNEPILAIENSIENSVISNFAFQKIVTKLKQFNISEEAKCTISTIGTSVNGLYLLSWQTV